MSTTTDPNPEIPDQEEKVRRRAYEIWESEGCPDAKHRDHWRQAEQEIKSGLPAGEDSTNKNVI